MAFDLSSYEPVAHRIARFWEDHPEGAIYSELIFDDGERCVVKATVHFIKGEPAVSSDYAEEMKTDRGVNSTSRIENCCTSAQGRALSAAGYLGSDWTKKATREEMSKVSRAENPNAGHASPTPSGASSHTPTGTFATPKQIGYIKKLAKDGGLDDLRLLELIQRELNSDEAVLELLKSHEASRIIEVLK
jgi:hypothetical protein